MYNIEKVQVFERGTVCALLIEKVHGSLCDLKSEAEYDFETFISFTVLTWTHEGSVKLPIRKKKRKIS